MSTSTLDHRLTDVRRRVRQVLVTHGVSWLAAAVIGSVLLVCVGDWLIHFDDPIVRLIFDLAIVGGAAYVARRHLIGPLMVRLTDTDLALRIEDRYPGFEDSLASSVQFMRSGGDPRIGSPALQQAVVEKTLDRLNGLDCDDVVDTREVRRIAGVALGVCLATMLLAGLNQTLTTIALKRFMFPFSAPAWPKKTNLQLLNADLVPLEFDADRPLHIARGDTLKVFAENTSGRLPSRVTLEYRLADHKTVSEVMRPTTMNDAQGNHREVAVGQMLTVRGELEFRAVGGDDDQMPWYRVLAVPPPVVEKLQVTLTPPKYTHRPAERQPDGVGHVQGLVGTRVDISAMASKPVEKATLRIKDQERHKLQLGADGQALKASFVIGDAGIHLWWLELKDPQGFEDAEPPRYEVRGLQDFEPEIYIEQPASDMQVTATALVPVRTVARDDLGLKQIRLAYKVEPAEGVEEESISLFLAGDELPLAHTAEHLWKIADLQPQAGARIVFHTEATDEFDLSAESPRGKSPPAHIGRSVTRTLTIVSSADKAQEIAQRQEGLLNDLERAFKLEQQAHAQVDDLLVQIENAEKFRPEDLDTLQRTEMGQREVAAQLNNPATGLEKRARDLAEELRNNQIVDPQTERRLKRIADELGRIGQEHLRPIEQELTQARKLVQARDKSEKSRARTPDGAKKSGVPGTSSDTPSDKSQDAGAKSREEGTDSKVDSGSKKAADVSKGDGSKKAPRKSNGKKQPGDRPEDALREVSENQNAVLESIGEMLQDLSQWRGEHDAAGELADLVRQQSELNQRAAELAKKTLTKSADALTPQEQADLAKIAERQKKQADQLEQLESRMRGTAENLAGENPSAAATLQEAVEQSQQEGIAGEMRDAAGQIGENRMGQAARSQQEILQKLHELENTLRQKRESDTEMMVKKLKQAGEELQNLRDRQAELLRKSRATEKNDNPQEREEQLAELRKEQQKLQEETARMARRLARLEAHKAQASAARAAGKMQQAQDHMGDGDQTGAGQEQQEALDDLEQAQRELAREQRAQEEQLARERLAKAADELAGMIPRQQSVIDETRRLDKVHAQAGKWSRAQLVSLRDLAKAQLALEEEADRMIDRLSAVEVFALALKGAARHMHAAGEQLAQRQTGTPTQKIEEAARKRISDLVDALKPDEPGPNAAQPPPDQQGGGASEQESPPGDGIPALAQVKMLITLQRELFSRTAEIEKLRGKDGQLPPAAHVELDSIAREQGDLADLTRNLSGISSPADDEEDEDENSNAKPKPE